MPSPFDRLTTLLLLLLPMVLVVTGTRLYHHLLGVRHLYIGGYLVRHLFFGALLVIPAAFVLAFGTTTRWGAVIARVAVGVGAGLLLDEIVFLIATAARDNDYVSTVSLVGSVVLVLVASVVLFVLYAGSKE